MTTNLFTYCNNSPSNYSDPTGYEVDCFGIFASAKAFVGSSILAFIAIDDLNKVAFMYTSSVVISTNAGFSAGVYLSYHRKKDSYKELLGSSWSISAGISLGANFSVSFSGKLEEICVSGGGGVSLFPIELSVSYGTTACIKELQQGKVSKVTYSKRIGIRRKKISVTMRTYKKYVCVTNSLTNRKLKYIYKSKQVKSYS